MAKYEFHRMSSEEFEHMAQALLEKKRRGFGNLIQFGSGPDGAREATWTQPPDHPDCVKSPGSSATKAKNWVFQVKYHDIGLRGWKGAGDALINDLGAELNKLVNKHRVPCDHYVLITNVPLSGVRNLGTRDQLSKIAIQWSSKVQEVEVWDAVDLSKMLDNNSDVRSAYETTILPGDVLRVMLKEASFRVDRRNAAFKGYLLYLIKNESGARADEAGDEDQLPLSKVYVDQSLRLDVRSITNEYRDTISTIAAEYAGDDEDDPFDEEIADAVPSSVVLLLDAQEKSMLLAGPGYGKSTITQFLTLYHAARLIKPELAACLVERLKLPAAIAPSTLDAHFKLRFPFRIELRRYAKWRQSSDKDGLQIGIAAYIARELIGRNVESHLDAEDIFELAHHNPTIVILDGLDEVPNRNLRDNILSDCQAFLHRCSGEDVDLQLVMSSRPQGYNGEFDRFDPIRWQIKDLSQSEFYAYCNAWLAERIKNAEEREEASERIQRGMTSESVQRLASTLLQATVMLTIARRKSDIPDERHKLYAKYVEVIFEREKAKNELISKYETELRHLHETVGYRLHEAVGRGDEGTLPQRIFSDCVRDVWHLSRGSEHFCGVLNQEYENIVELATNRLVFLSGKGEHQTEIDFVIQPYREFFAAQYMNFHTQGDPDKVYDCLVKRGAFWANVLQFYVALEKPAQQTRWIRRAVELSTTMLENEGIVESTEYRRAALQHLPEYARLSHEELTRALEIIFPAHDLWTWGRQDWAIDVLRNLRSGEGVAILSRILNSSPPSDAEDAFVMLKFLSRAMTPGSAEYQPFLGRVKELGSQPHLTDSVVEACLLFCIPIDITAFNEGTVLKVIQALPSKYTPAEMRQVLDSVSRMTRTAALRALCIIPTLYPLKSLTIWEYLDLPVEHPISVIRHTQITSGGCVFSASLPRWVKTSAVGGEGKSALSPNVDDPIELYFLALYAALLDPLSAELDRVASEAEASAAKALCRPLMPGMKSEDVLGPRSSDFATVRDWIEYKTGVKALFDDGETLSNLIDALTSSTDDKDHVSYPWTALLFHPTQWHLLKDEGLMSEPDLYRMRNGELGRLLALPTSHVAPITLTPRDSMSFHSFPWCSLMRVALRAHKAGMLHDSPIARSSGPQVVQNVFETGNIREIISSIADPNSLPISWLRLLMDLTLCLGGQDVSPLVQIWGRLDAKNRAQVIFGSAHGADLQDTITKIAKIESPDSLGLAATLLRSGAGTSAELSLDVNRRICGELSNGQTLSRDSVCPLLGLRATAITIDEVVLYSNSDWFNSARSTVYRFDRLVADRISRLPQIIPTAEAWRATQSLRSIVTQRKRYPLVVAAAALDAMIQMTVSLNEPLNESMWQSA